MPFANFVFTSFQSAINAVFEIVASNALGSVLNFIYGAISNLFNLLPF